jgi:glycosyltransferase involved in cell wall biosynthesis
MQCDLIIKLVFKIPYNGRMRIVIDARMLYWTGVGRYTKALLDNLQGLDSSNEYLVLRRNVDRELWNPSTPNFKVVDVDINPYTIGEQTRLVDVIRGLKPGLVHFTTPNAAFSYDGPKVITVHDLTLLDYDTSRGIGISKRLKKLKRLPFRFILSRNIRSAQALITPTEYVKQQLIDRFRAMPSRVHVTLLAADKNMSTPESIDRFNAGREFLLYVGTAYPYKNASLIIQALALLKAKYPQLKLVITSRPDYFRELLQDLALRLGVQDKVIFTGFVSDGELVTLYRKAIAYVYPSLSEGFGLQGLEAMAQGLPVLAARTTSLPEVCGNGAEYFDARDASDLATKIQTLVSNDKLRSELIQRGEARVRSFSWRKTAEDTLAIYNATK